MADNSHPAAAEGSRTLVVVVGRCPWAVALELDHGLLGTNNLDVVWKLQQSFSTYRLDGTAVSSKLAVSHRLRAYLPPCFFFLKALARPSLPAANLSRVRACGNSLRPMVHFQFSKLFQSFPL